MRFLVPVALLGTMAAAQSVAPAPAFEAADVHPSPKRTSTEFTGGVQRGGRFELRNASLLDLVMMAYGKESDYVVGGPPWLELDRFDMVAKVPPKTSDETVNLMLRSLLEDRFKLAAHEEERSRPGFALVQAKSKHKMKESSESSANCQNPPQEQTSGGINFQGLVCRGIPMEFFATILRQIAPQSARGPVIDATGLSGGWDFQLKFTPAPLIVRAGDEAIPFAEALEKQLGLALEPRTVPTKVLVVESAIRVPTPNAPNLDEIMPKPPLPSFEISTVKPSPANATNQTGNFGNGRLDLGNYPLKDLLKTVWDVLSDDFLAGAPPSLATRYDITAKAFSDNEANNNVDFETLKLMVQQLITQRFNLKVHWEDRDVSAWTLKADKPKLKAADPVNRSTCNQNPLPGQKDPRQVTPQRNRLYTCTNVTIAEFAERLQPFANGYLTAPVTDSTGLDGRYDFMLSFSGQGLVRQALAAAANNTGDAAEPTTAISLFDAVASQLGLRLEKQTRKLPVLVIDHVDDRPTEN